MVIVPSISMENCYRIPFLRGLRISGEDAISFCQSQFCADLRNARSHQWLTTAWCNPKGRARIVIIVACHQHRVELVFPLSQSALVEALMPYAIGRRLQFSELLPVVGSFAAIADAAVLGSSPQRTLQLDDPARPGAEPPQDWLLRWQWADLCLPLPWLSPATSERFLPQFLGLEETGGLSFQKGCYPGQEVIARLHYLGQVKHRLSAFATETALSTPEIAADAKLLRPDGSAAGDVLQRLLIGEKCFGLAVCASDIEDNEGLRLSVGGREIPARLAPPDSLCYYQKGSEQSN